MNSTTPKQFLKINGKEMILYSLETFSKCEEIDHIILVSNDDYIDECCILAKGNNINKILSIVGGGKTRQESVFKGLEEAKKHFKDCNILVHDAARPFVSERIILDNINALKSHVCCTTAIPSKDSIYEVKDGKVKKGLDRSLIYLAQTPQSGKLILMYSAYKSIKGDFTDEASLLASFGKEPYIVLGEQSNIKITTKEDLDFLNIGGKK